MKSFLIVLGVACLAASTSSQACPTSCLCSDGKNIVARCSQLDSDMFFSERVHHLVIESMPNVHLNLTKSLFSKIGLHELLTIKIVNCSISYIDAGAFEGLNQLTDVNLSDNGLILIHPDTFKSNSHLERLSLSGNPLQLTQLLKAEENYFLNSTSLLELDLSRCQLSDIGKKLLAQVPNLQYISFKSNNIKVIDDYIFENVPFLDEVDLSDNMLMSLNDGIFEDIDELTVLNLRNNLIEKIDDLDLPGLKELDVSHNKIKLLTKLTFQGIIDLTSLNLSHNGIQWISEETFKDLEELRHLDLSYNALKGPLPKFILEENEFIETLYLAGNDKMHIFKGFSTGLPRLYKLDISDCGLFNVTNSSFSGMPNLAILNMSMNSLTTLNHVVMSKLHRLNDLDISFNNISKVGAYTFASNSHLRKLNFTHNNIHHLSPNTFETTPHLSLLDISHNQFPHLWHANDSQYMKDNKILNELEYLDIAGNRIKELHKAGFVHLTNLRAINIVDNPLECTSEFPVFIEWLYTNHIRPLYMGKSVKQEEKLEKSNLQWDHVLTNVCKLQPEKIEIKTKEIIKGDEDEMEKGHNLNFYHYTVIEDVKLRESKLESEAAGSTEKEKVAEEISTYVWPTFLIVFSLVFLTLAIGNMVALLIYRSRNQCNAPGFKTAFVSPFKRTIVKLDASPRYHKLYEECSVPNTPIVKGNLFENIVSSQVMGATVLSKSRKDDSV